MWNTLTKIIRVPLYLVFFLNCIALVLSIVSPYVPISSNSIVSTFGLFFPFFYIINVVILVCLIAIKDRLKWWPLFFFLISIPAFSHIFGFNLLNSSPVVKPITIASFNMQFSKPIALLSEDDIEYQTLLFKNELSQHNDIDIMAVQEYGDVSRAIVESALAMEYDHTIPGMAVSILSKHPIVSSGIVDFQSNVANTCLWADIVIASDTLRVYSYHLESNRHDGEVPEVIHQDAREEKTMSMMTGIVKYYKLFSNKRFSQAQLIVDHASDCKYPMVLCGDLNDTPQSYLYHYMRTYYSDAFLHKGRGSGRTIESRVPWLRIDYIFADEKVDFIDYENIHSPYSDHYLLKSKVVITD